MSIFTLSHATPTTADTGAYSPIVSRAFLLAAVVAGAGAVIVVGGTSTPASDADLVGLLRFMAVLKAALALALIGAVWWRLASPITPWRLAAYAATSAAMTAGPMLIWMMAHLGLGAALLHAGLLAACLLLWRDPAVATRLSVLVARRR